MCFEIWPKRLFENLRKLPKNGHFWPTTCNSDNPKFMRINSKFVIFRTTKILCVMVKDTTWKLYVREKKVLNQQTDYRNKNLKYRSTNDVNYHVSLSCDNLNLLVLSLMLVVKGTLVILILKFYQFYCQMKNDIR